MRTKSLITSLIPYYGMNSRFRLFLYVREVLRKNHLTFLNICLKNYLLSKNGCELSINAKISPKAEFMHTTGIVIGEGSEVKAGVKIYSNVVLGRKDINNLNDYPTINENVVLSTGVTILGNVRIDSGVIIGANSLVLNNIDSGVWAGTPAQQIN